MKCEKNFFYCIYRFSLVKAAMNAARVCKLRNCVNKRPHFCFFIAKGNTKTRVHLLIAEGLRF
jgi:hypothetical protein